MHFHTVSEHRIIPVRVYILCRSEFEDLVRLSLSQIETEKNTEILKLKVLVMLKIKYSEIEH